MTHGDSHGPSSAPGARSPWLLVFGWLLALPGLWVILSFLLLAPLSRGAGRPAPQGSVSVQPAVVTLQAVGSVSMVMLRLV
jgi:hypothetical protein